MKVMVEHILSPTWKKYAPSRNKNLSSLFLSYEMKIRVIFLSSNVSETKTLLYLYEMINVN